MKNSVIIVLGNYIDESGQLNKESCSRLDLAIDLFRQNKHAFIITSGWDYYAEYNIAIADAMKSYIVNNSHISDELVLTEINFEKKNPIFYGHLCIIDLKKSDFFCKLQN